MKVYSLSVIFTSVLFLISGTDDFFKHQRIEMMSIKAKEIKIIPLTHHHAIQKKEEIKIYDIKKKTDCINNRSKDILYKLKIKKAVQNAKLDQTSRESL